MSEVSDAIEAKFGEAEELFLEGKNPFLVDNGSKLGLVHEIIGLDCLEGGSGQSRYVVSRPSLDTQITIGASLVGNSTDFVVTHTIVRIPRMKGDHRAFESLPRIAELDSEKLVVDGVNGNVLELTEAGPNMLSQVASDGLAAHIRSLRVVSQLPSQR